MNALKHMELIFGVVVVVAGCAIAMMPMQDSRGAQKPAPANVKTEAARPAMPVVVVRGKRLSALERRELRGVGAPQRHPGLANASDA
jgi:hypothetical protein